MKTKLHLQDVGYRIQDCIYYAYCITQAGKYTLCFLPVSPPSSPIHTSIYKFGLSVCLFVCLSVCLYPINVKTAEPNGPKFFVGHHVTTGKGMIKWSKFQIFVSIKIRSSLYFLKFWKSAKFFVKICELFLFCFCKSLERRARSALNF